MRVVKNLTIALLISAGFAGCASRRCCTCSCHKQKAVQSVASAAVENRPVRLTIADIDVVATPEVAIKEDAFESKPPVVLEDPIAAPQEEDIPSALVEVPPERPIFEPPAIETKPRFELAKTTTQPKPETENDEEIVKNETIYAHADDYSWLKGHLQRVHVPGVEWKIRYMSIDEADQWGGSMVLAPDIRLEDHEDGDAIYIHGSRLEDRPSLYITGPLYRIKTIEPQKPVTPDSEGH